MNKLYFTKNGNYLWLDPIAKILIYGVTNKCHFFLNNVYFKAERERERESHTSLPNEDDLPVLEK